MFIRRKKKATPRKDVKQSSKLLYAVYDLHMKHLFNREYASEASFKASMARSARSGKPRTGILLNGSNEPISATQIKVFERHIEQASAWLTQQDIKDLKAVLKIVRTKPAKYGMAKAAVLDTIVRDQIPSVVWRAMGGETTF